MTPSAKVAIVGQRHRNLGLAEEIAHELGRIVTAGIFEINEHDPPVVVGERIVKAEVGRRGAQRGFGKVGAGVEVFASGGSHNASLNRVPGGTQLLCEEGACLGGMRCGRVDRSQACNASLYSGKMRCQRKASLRSSAER